MLNKKIKLILVAVMSFFILTGFGLKDLKKEIGPDKDSCKGSKNKSKCEDKEKLKSLGKVVAVGVAAKLLYDLVVEYTSANVKGDHEIIEIYLKKNKTLPKQPEVISYEANISPSATVKVGKEITIKTSLAVVPSSKSRKVKIEENIEIYDNEDKAKKLKSLVKVVNGKDQKAGAYENQFTFTLPVGMPQGVYPIKTAVIVDGKRHEAKSNAMQVVLHVMPDNNYVIAYK